MIFDRRLLRARRARAAALGPATFLLERVAEDLAERLAAVLRRFDCALDLGTPTDALRRVLAASGKVGTIIAANAWPASASPSARALRRDGGRGGVAVRDASLDLVVSALALQFVNDLPGHADPDPPRAQAGWPAARGLLGGDTLTELRQAFAAAEAEIEGGDVAASRAVCRRA